MTKKYELTNETINYYGKVLHRIKSLINFNNVKKGDIGGFIEKEDNLSHDGYCWIYNDAKVYDDARVCGNAEIYGDAEVFDNAIVHGNAKIYDNAGVCDNARVFDNAKVYDNADVFNNAMVCGNAKVYDDAGVLGNARVGGNAVIYGNARIFDNARIYNNAEVYGYARVFDSTKVFDNAEICNAKVGGKARISNNAYILSNKDYLCIGPMGSRDDYTTFYLDKNRNIYVKCGCFCDTIDKFKDKVIETHKDNEYAKRYLSSISFAKDNFNNI